jgi:hypothetical protein
MTTLGKSNFRAGAIREKHLNIERLPIRKRAPGYDSAIAASGNFKCRRHR